MTTSALSPFSTAGARESSAVRYLFSRPSRLRIGSQFTVYVVTVRKQNSQWRIFRRYKEWEDLRVRLHQWCGGSPQMPGKSLFGRMRPEVIEQRVLGLNQFLQQSLTSPQFACPDLIDFLEREKNMPPPGLELDFETDEANPDAASGPEGSAEQAKMLQLKQLVESTSAAFIPVSNEPPAVDPSYLADRAATYAATLKPSEGPAAGSVISLAPPTAPPPTVAAVESALERLLAAAEGSADPEATSLALSTAKGLGEAMAALQVQGKHEVTVSVG